MLQRTHVWKDGPTVHFWLILTRKPWGASLGDKGEEFYGFTNRKECDQEKWKDTQDPTTKSLIKNLHFLKISGTKDWTRTIVIVCYVSLLAQGYTPCVLFTF